jgi:uncharacterized membrane-anchored protein YhcB (DUF1043 family)
MEFLWFFTGLAIGAWSAFLYAHKQSIKRNKHLSNALTRAQEDVSAAKNEARNYRNSIAALIHQIREDERAIMESAIKEPEIIPEAKPEEKPEPEPATKKKPRK